MNAEPVVKKASRTIGSLFSALPKLNLYVYNL